MLEVRNAAQCLRKSHKLFLQHRPTVRQVTLDDDQYYDVDNYGDQGEYFYEEEYTNGPDDVKEETDQNS